MTWYVVLFLLLAASWMLLFMTLGFADSMLRRQVCASLEVRQWHETVQAMRRMAHEEGDV